MCRFTVMVMTGWNASFFDRIVTSVFNIRDCFFPQTAKTTLLSERLASLGFIWAYLEAQSNPSDSYILRDFSGPLFWPPLMSRDASISENNISLIGVVFQVWLLHSETFGTKNFWSKLVNLFYSFSGRTNLHQKSPTFWSNIYVQLLCPIVMRPRFLFSGFGNCFFFLFEEKKNSFGNWFLYSGFGNWFL